MLDFPPLSQDVPRELRAHDDAYAKRAALPCQRLKASAVAHAVSLIEDQQSSQAPRLLPAQRIAMKLNDDDLSQSRLDFVVWQFRQFE